MPIPPVDQRPAAVETNLWGAPAQASWHPQARAAGADGWQLPGGLPGAGASLADKLVLPSLDANKLLGGDWAGAAAVAAAGLLTAIGLSALLLLLAGISHLPGGLAVTAVVIVACAAFGSDAVFDARGADVHTSVGVYPLTITIGVLAVIAMLFWRRIRSRRPGFGEALGEAVRTGLVFAVALGVITLVVRAHLNGTGFSSGLLPTASTSTVHGSTAGAVFGGFLLSTLVCAVACLRKREWLPARVLAVRDLVGAPLAGLGATLVSAAILSVVGLVIGSVALSNGPTSAASNAAGQGSGAGQNLGAGLVLLVLALPTLAVYGLYVGIGAAFSTAGSGALGGVFGSTAAGSADVHYRITNLADFSSWWWLTSVGAIISLLLGALVVAYLSGSLQRARRTLLVFLALLVVVTPLLTHLTAGYGHVHAQSANADGRFGISTPGALLAALLVGLIVVLVASAIAPSLFARPGSLPPTLPQGASSTMPPSQPPQYRPPAGGSEGSRTQRRNDFSDHPGERG